MINKVIFILDEKFNGDLREVALKNHVWIVGSPDNKNKSRKFLDENKNLIYPDQGVTTTNTGHDKVKILSNYLDEIDIHHNEHSTNNPWNLIEVIGIDINCVDLSEIKNCLPDYQIEVMPIVNGFQIIKSAQQTDASETMA